MEGPVCFHGRKACPFCFPDGRSARAGKRCACCGRGVKRSPKDRRCRCGRCRQHGYVALRLAV